MLAALNGNNSGFYGIQPEKKTLMDLVEKLADLSTKFWKEIDVNVLGPKKGGVYGV